eukprot:TRINITY_DN6641_c0_g1_i12.p1 TRINITY_DN6641_c0_g1~~TRINITY_DN6641_c0_g1_i12.p1  ORF type:complete len:445 (+),score=80.73 TRINITY_DN6641_c0_g1_i12:520-1854(+)
MSISELSGVPLDWISLTVEVSRTRRSSSSVTNVVSTIQSDDQAQASSVSTSLETAASSGDLQTTLSTQLSQTSYTGSLPSSVTAVTTSVTDNAIVNSGGSDTMSLVVYIGVGSALVLLALLAGLAMYAYKRTNAVKADHGSAVFVEEPVSIQRGAGDIDDRSPRDTFLKASLAQSAAWNKEVVGEKMNPDTVRFGVATDTSDLPDSLSKGSPELKEAPAEVVGRIIDYSRKRQEARVLDEKRAVELATKKKKAEQDAIALRIEDAITSVEDSDYRLELAKYHHALSGVPPPMSSAETTQCSDPSQTDEELSWQGGTPQCSPMHTAPFQTETPGQNDWSDTQTTAGDALPEVYSSPAASNSTALDEDQLRLRLDEAFRVAAELAGFQQGMLGAAPPMSSAETSEALGAESWQDSNKACLVQRHRCRVPRLRKLLVLGPLRMISAK